MNLLKEYAKLIRNNNLDIYRRQLLHIFELNDIDAYLDEDKDIIINDENIKKIYFIIFEEGLYNKASFQFISEKFDKYSDFEIIFTELNIKLDNYLLEQFIYELT